VDQEHVDVVRPERVQGGVEGLAGVVGAVTGVAQLARDEDVRAVHAGGVDGLTDLLLVAVHLGGVDVPVTGLQGGGDGLGGVLGLDLEHAESELGDRLAVVQHDLGYRGHDELSST